MNENDSSSGGAASHAAPNAEHTRVVQRLTREHNLLILGTFVAGLGFLAALQTLRSQPAPREALFWLTIARIAAPLLALLASMFHTNAAISQGLSRAPAGALPVAIVTDAFRRSKLFSLRLVAAVALFADACLLFGARVLDLVLAVATWLLLVNMRPHVRALASFALTMESFRDAPAPDVGAADSAREARLGDP